MPFHIPRSAVSIASADDGSSGSMMAVPRNYSVPATDGQTLFVLDPAPLDLSSVALMINGTAYAAPNIAVSSASVTWQGPFDIAAADDVRLTYF